MLLSRELHSLVGGNFALFDFDLALAADAVAAAGGLNIEAGLGCGGQQIFPCLHLDGEVVGQEGNFLFHESPFSGEVLTLAGMPDSSSKQTTRFRPCSFASYRAWSAAPITSVQVLPCRGKLATPMLTVLRNGGAGLLMNR